MYETYDEPHDTELDSSIGHLDLYDSSITSNLYKLKRTRQVGMDEENMPIFKKVVIKAYGSGETGTNIINAVTGYTSKCKVGSRDERLFYSVAICTGEGRHRQPISLFYDSPEQYEEHYMTIVDDERKELWHKKYKAYLNELKSQ
jgi:hypothetical protein